MLITDGQATPKWFRVTVMGAVRDMSSDKWEIEINGATIAQSDPPFPANLDVQNIGAGNGRIIIFGPRPLVSIAMGRAYGLELAPTANYTINASTLIRNDTIGLNTNLVEAVHTEANTVGGHPIVYDGPTEYIYGPYDWFVTGAGGTSGTEDIGFRETSIVNDGLLKAWKNAVVTKFRPTQFDPNHIDHSYWASLEDTYVGAPPLFLNGLIHHRQGLHGWPSFKQIRGGNHPIVQKHRKENTISFRSDSGTMGFENVTEPVIETTLPTRIIDVKNSNYSIVYDDSFMTSNTVFANEKLNLATGQGVALTKSLLYSNYTYIDFKQRIFPKSIHIGLKTHRERTSFRVDYWNSDRDHRVNNPKKETVFGRIETTGPWPLDGHLLTVAQEQAAGTRIIDALPYYMDNGLRFVDPTSGEQYTISTVEEKLFGELMSNERQFVHRYLSYTNALGAEYASMRPGPAYISYFPVFKTYRDLTSQNPNGLWNKGARWDADGVDGVDGSVFFSNILAGDQKWTAADDHPIGPMYDSYEEWATDVRPLAPDFAIVPEYRIESQIDGLLTTETSVVNPEGTGNVFEIPESHVTVDFEEVTINSRHDDFYKIYSFSDFMKVFDLIEEESITPEVRKIRLSTTAIKKFLPYEGFYPAQRTAALETYFSSSYYPTLSAVGGTQATVTDTSTDPDTTYSTAWRPWSRSFFAPGILYNTIKSGIAVDYPVFTASYGTSPVSPYVVNYKQIGIGESEMSALFGNYDNVESGITGMQHKLDRAAMLMNDGAGPKYRYGAVMRCGGNFTGASAINQHGMYAANYFRTLFKGGTATDATLRRYWPVATGTDENNQFASAFPGPVRNALGDEQVKRAGFHHRIPFEAIIDPDKYVKSDLVLYDDGKWDSSAYVQVASSFGGASNPKYKLAANNFFAETINFFLPEGKLSSLKSKPDSEKSFGIVKINAEGYTYRMRLYLLREPEQLQTPAKEKNSYGRDCFEAIATRPADDIANHTGPNYEYETGEEPAVTFRKFLFDYFDQWSYDKGMLDPRTEGNLGSDGHGDDNDGWIDEAYRVNIPLTGSNFIDGSKSASDAAGAKLWLPAVMHNAIARNRVRNPDPSPFSANSRMYSRIVDSNDMYQMLYSKHRFNLDLRNYFYTEAARLTAYTPEDTKFIMYNNKAAFGPPCSSIEGWSTLPFPHGHNESTSDPFDATGHITVSDQSVDASPYFGKYPIGNNYYTYSEFSEFLSHGKLIFGIAGNYHPQGQAAGVQALDINEVMGKALVGNPHPAPPANPSNKPNLSGRPMAATAFDTHSYVGFLEPLLGYDFRPYTPPYYEGYAYVDYIFTPKREGKHSVEEIMASTEIELYRKRDLIKYKSVTTGTHTAISSAGGSGQSDLFKNSFSVLPDPASTLGTPGLNPDFKQTSVASSLGSYAYIPRFCGLDYPNSSGFLINESTWNPLNPLATKTPHSIHLDGYKYGITKTDYAGTGTINVTRHPATKAYNGSGTGPLRMTGQAVFYRLLNRIDSRKCLNHAGQMNLDSSMNLFGVTNVKNFEYDAEGNLQRMREDTNLGACWTISPKFETPIMNFKKWLAKEDNGDYTYASKIEPTGYRRRDTDTIPEPIVGMWHQYGDLPNKNEGLQMTLVDTPGETLYAQPATATVLIESIDLVDGTIFTLQTENEDIEVYHAQAAASDVYFPVGASGTRPVYHTSGPGAYHFASDGDTTSVVASNLATAITNTSKHFTAQSNGPKVRITTITTGPAANNSTLFWTPTMYTQALQHAIPRILSEFNGGASEIKEHGSLADLVGFTKGKMTPLGRTAESKKVKEAIIAIPMMKSQGGIGYEIPTFSTHAPGATAPDNAKKLVARILRSPPNKGTIEKRELEDIPTSLVHMVDKMQNYVLPPRLNFLDYPDEVEPYLCFVLEFEHKFTQRDLADIWQNLYPRDSAKVEIVKDSFEHDLSNFPDFVLDNNTRWMVFKVKQKAKKNYFNHVDKGIKDLLRFTPRGTMALKEEIEQEPVYSYNWPYDYFSLVELVKIDAEVNLTNGNIPTLEEYMKLAAEIGDTDNMSPSQLMSLVENASIDKGIEDRERALSEAKAKMAAQKAAEERRRNQVTISKRILRGNGEDLPKNTPYFVNSRGEKIRLSVDPEGSYYYYRQVDKSGREFAVAEGPKATRVVVKALGRRSE